MTTGFATNGQKLNVLGVHISVGPFAGQLSRFADWGRQRRSAYVCCVNAHMTVEARRDPSFAVVVNGADAATPDGMPVLRSLEWFHGIRQERVAGNDLMPALMAEAARRGLSIYLYGGRPDVLDAIRGRAARELPELVFAGIWSPPFREPTASERLEDIARINESGAHIVFVSLGCPKQERWMADMRGKIDALMLGVGGAFLLYAGVDHRAPEWMRNLSLEWLYRLVLEPRRLWKRYLVTNTLFIWYFLRELVARRADRR